MDNLFKFFLIILILFIICILTGSNDYFSNTDKMAQGIELLFTNEMHFNYLHNDDVVVSELAFKIANSAKKDPVLLQKIDQKILNISKEIMINSELKNYLKFKNCINNDGMIFFIHEDPMEFLKHKIKILLILLSRKNLNLINI
jgi:hypothetical protein